MQFKVDELSILNASAQIVPNGYEVDGSHS